MPSVVHVVVTENFAGVERYVCTTACETAARGWDVAVIGGDPAGMQGALGSDVQWLPGGRATRALRSLRQVGRVDVCHAHMTIGEAVAVFGRLGHHAPVVSTRHFAQPRGASRVGRVVGPWIQRGLSYEIAVSAFVARSVERAPDAVIPSGVPVTELLWRSESRTVLVLQRLEREKDTITALRAWRESGLCDVGWAMRVVGDGSERRPLERWVAENGVLGVMFAGFSSDVTKELARAGLLIAPATAEPFGLGVVEAMMAGVPVVVAASGGHLETAGRVQDHAMFPPRDVHDASRRLQAMVDAQTRGAASRAVAEYAKTHLSLERSVDQLLEAYREVIRQHRGASGGIARGA